MRAPEGARRDRAAHAAAVRARHARCVYCALRAHVVRVRARAARALRGARPACTVRCAHVHAHNTYMCCAVWVAATCWGPDLFLTPTAAADDALLLYLMQYLAMLKH